MAPVRFMHGHCAAIIAKSLLSNLHVGDVPTLTPSLVGQVGCGWLPAVTKFTHQTYSFAVKYRFKCVAVC